MPESGNLPCAAVVDDEAEMISAYELLFKRRNIPVAFAMIGEEAPERFRQADSRPKVAIIDFRLPDMDNLALMSEIRSMEPGTQVIMISGDIAGGQKCQDSGAVAFFKKPTGIRENTDTVSRLLSV